MAQVMAKVPLDALCRHNSRVGHESLKAEALIILGITAPQDCGLLEGMSSMDN